MTATLIATTPTPFRHPSSQRNNKFRTLVRIVLLGCLLAPVSLLAGGLSGLNTLSSLQIGTLTGDIALHEWPNDATQLFEAPERLGEQHIQSLTEEAGKQAQAEYLAKKFKQRMSAVRKYVDLAWAEAEKRDGLEPELLIAIMQKESSLRPRVQSRYGAQGLMQVVRRWHREKLDASESLFDPEVNIRVAADILEEYLELAGGSLPKALVKYSGNARGYSGKILRESRKLAHVADQAALNAL
jgi:soluble lytic murein transglycosylase-like protein